MKTVFIHVSVSQLIDTLASFISGKQQTHLITIMTLINSGEKTGITELHPVMHNRF